MTRAGAIRPAKAPYALGPEEPRGDHLEAVGRDVHDAHRDGDPGTAAQQLAQAAGRRACRVRHGGRAYDAAPAGGRIAATSRSAGRGVGGDADSEPGAAGVLVGAADAWSVLLAGAAARAGPGARVRADLRHGLGARPRARLGRLGLGSGLPRAVPSDAVVAVLDEVVPGDAAPEAGAARRAGRGRAGAPAAGARTCRWPPGSSAVSLVEWNPFVAERLLIGPLAGAGRPTPCCPGWSSPARRRRDDGRLPPRRCGCWCRSRRLSASGGTGRRGRAAGPGRRRRAQPARAGRAAAGCWPRPTRRGWSPGCCTPAAATTDPPAARCSRCGARGRCRPRWPRSAWAASGTPRSCRASWRAPGGWLSSLLVVVLAAARRPRRGRRRTAAARGARPACLLARRLGARRADLGGARGAGLAGRPRPRWRAGPRRLPAARALRARCWSCSSATAPPAGPAGCAGDRRPLRLTAARGPRRAAGDPAAGPRARRCRPAASRSTTRRSTPRRGPLVDRATRPADGDVLLLPFTSYRAPAWNTAARCSTRSGATCAATTWRATCWSCPAADRGEDPRVGARWPRALGGRDAPRARPRRSPRSASGVVVDEPAPGRHPLPAVAGDDPARRRPAAGDPPRPAPPRAGARGAGGWRWARPGLAFAGGAAVGGLPAQWPPRPRDEVFAAECRAAGARC